MSDNIFGLMSRVIPLINEKFPWTEALTWVVIGDDAGANVDALGGMWREGTTLKLALPPNLLPLIDYLYTAHGWKRGGWHESWGWRAYTYVIVGDLQIRIVGNVRERPDGRDDTMSALFAPPPPPMRQSKKWVEEMKEYDRKSREDEW